MVRNVVELNVFKVGCQDLTNNEESIGTPGKSHKAYETTEKMKMAKQATTETSFVTLSGSAILPDKRKEIMMRMTKTHFSTFNRLNIHFQSIHRINLVVPSIASTRERTRAKHVFTRRLSFRCQTLKFSRPNVKFYFSALLKGKMFSIK